MINLTKFAGTTMRAGTIAAACLAGVFSASHATAQSYPSEQLNWTIAFGPGGGNDIMSRTLIDILKKYEMYPGDISAENRSGGSGAVGWGYLYSKSGDAYNISSTSGSFITTPLQADTPWKPADFVPIALLATDDLALMVNADSEFEDIQDFIDTAKEKPLTIGGTGTVNVDFIVPTLFAEQAGFTFDYVSFNAMADMQTALLSKAVDAMVANPGEIIGLVESGDLRALVYSGVKTPSELPGVPTMAEVGFDVGVSMPRGLILAPGAPAEAQEWWIETIKKVVETPEWAAYINTNQLTENIKYGEDFTTFLNTTQEGFAKVLRAQGVIK